MGQKLSVQRPHRRVGKLRRSAQREHSSCESVRQARSGSGFRAYAPRPGAELGLPNETALLLLIPGLLEQPVVDPPVGVRAPARGGVILGHIGAAVTPVGDQPLPGRSWRARIRWHLLPVPTKCLVGRGDVRAAAVPAVVDPDWDVRKRWQRFTINENKLRDVERVIRLLRRLPERPRDVDRASTPTTEPGRVDGSATDKWAHIQSL